MILHTPKKEQTVLSFPCLDQQGERGVFQGAAPLTPGGSPPILPVSPHRYRPRALGMEVWTLACPVHDPCVLLGT